MISRRTVVAGAAYGVVAGALWATGAIAEATTDPLVERLIGEMSLIEKVGQLSILRDLSRPAVHTDVPIDTVESKRVLLELIRAGKLTGVFNGLGVSGARELQKAAIEQSPRGIPLIFAADVIHGVRTVFPIPLGESAAFDIDLAERTARAAAVEATALGLHWTFAPMVDVARDQRWGRVAEGAGEDTFLGRQLAAARTRGFQTNRLSDDDAMLACAKHFAGYGGVEGGMEYNTVDISEATLRAVHLPPYQAAFDAGLLSVMASFSDVGGIPATGNRKLLTGILRKEMGFRGLVVSDSQSDKELIAHGYAADGPDAVFKAIMAGCDMSMTSNFYNMYLPDLVTSGRVPMAVVDESVRRVLRVKKALGLFDNPYRSMDARRERTQLRTPAALALSREAGRRSIVLLKNDGQLLPLPKSGRRIALIGPFASDRANLNGPWALFANPAEGVTLEEGLRTVLKAPGALTVVKGCDVEAPEAGGIDAAVAAARDADVVVLAVGESSGMSGEAQARLDIGLPEAQLALADAVAATGKPMVVLLRHGRALAVEGSVRNAPAILATWFLGSETGHAIADVLFGDVEPEGRLPVSFPQASGQEPFYYDHRSTGRPQVSPDVPGYKGRYREVSFAALYPFGHGLGYSTADYGATAVGEQRLAWNGTLDVEVTVRNSGRRKTRELVQLYVHDRAASITQPVRALKGFQHVDLASGESRTVHFTLRRADLEIVTADLVRAAEPGLFDVWIAPSSSAGTPAQFELLAG